MDERLPAGLDRLWDVREQPAREPKPGLTVDRIVRAAVELADAGGLAAVSMSRVAERLGYTTMSLYRHVRNKDELLVLMLDAALVLGPAPPAEGWRAGLERWAWDVLAVVRRHPWWLQIQMAPPPATPNSVLAMERGLAPLAGTPLNEDEKASLILTLNGYVMWQARLETELAEGTGSPSEDALAAYREVMKTRIDRERFPAVRAVVDAGVFDDEEDTRDADFAYGLDIWLDGVERLIERRLASSAAPSAGSGSR
jgi:AcrR family transcriptional regulator